MIHVSIIAFHAYHRTQFLSTGVNIVIDYTVSVTGAGDPTTIPTQDGMVFVLKAGLMCFLPTLQQNLTQP